MSAHDPPYFQHSPRVEPANVVTWSWNVVTGEVTWAKGIEEALFGMAPGTFAGTFEAYLGLVHPDDRAYFQAVIARTLAGEDEYVMAHRVVWPDGSEHWIDGRGTLSRDAEGRPLLLSGVAWTATARKRSETRFTHLERVQAVAGAVSKELLRASREEEAFDAACRIAVEHGGFRFAWIGSFVTGAPRFTVLARAGLEDGYLDEISPTIDLESPPPLLRAVRETGGAVINDIATDPRFMPWRDSALRRGFRSAALLPLRRGGVVQGAFAIYAQDEGRFAADQVELLRGLTDDIGFKLDALDAEAHRRVAEEAMRRTEERYRTLVEQLIVSDRLASLGRLAADVAHEINNPLAYVSLSLERISRATSGDDLDAAAIEEITAATADARDGANRVRAVTRSLGVLSRDDEGVIGPVDVHRVLDGAIRLSENSLRHRGRVVKDYRARRTVSANELRLGQVFVNLLVNASDALRDETPADNEILVRTLDDGDRVIIEVRDNGVGIAPEIGARIFEPFFTTKPAGQGTGLGLAISHGIVSSYGGEIAVESAPAGGTIFRISLVAGVAFSSEPPSGVVHRRQAIASRLLIVDDEARLAQSLASTLAAHDVTLATSCAEALALCRTRDFDVILCDLLMPGSSGVDLHAELVRDGRGLDARMIFMTGGTSTARMRDFLAGQPNEVLEKPFGASRVEAAIARVIERADKAKKAT